MTNAKEKNVIMSRSRQSALTLYASTFIGATSALSTIDDVTYAIGVGGDLIIAQIDNERKFTVKSKAHFSHLHRVRTVQTRRIGNDGNTTVVFAAAHRTLGVYRLSRSLVLQRIAAVNADERIVTINSATLDGATNSTAVLLGTAHNTVERWILSDAPSMSFTRTHVLRGERCILYAMSVHQTTVFAGTVYGDIIMWSAAETQHLPVIREVQQRLSGHRGVVFSIDVADDMSLIASASDDRTVIIWKRHDDGAYAQQSILYGHASRIWQCRFILQNTHVVSCGEDGTVRCWNVRSGECTSKLTCRAGIRNIAIQHNRRSAILAVDDGSIQIWDCLQRSQTAAIFVLNDEVETKHDDESKDKQKLQLFTELCRHLNLCDDESIILASSLHTLKRLIPLSVSEKSYQSFPISTHKQDGNIPDVIVTVLSLSLSAEYIAVGCKNGALYVTSLLDHTLYSYTAVHRAAVTYILWMTSTSNTSSAQIISADALGNIKHWRLDILASSMTLILLTSFRLANQSSVTAALALENVNAHILLFGDMRGSLYVYTVHMLSDGRSVIVARVRLIDVHETCALTCFLLTSQSSIDGATFISAGRNDTINYYTLNHANSDMSNQVAHNVADGQDDDDTWRSHHNGLISAEDMTNINQQSSRVYLLQHDRAYRIRGLTSAERIWLDDDTDTMFACGFRSDAFVLVDVTNETVICTIECGGGRRPWDYDQRKHIFLFSRRTKTDQNEIVHCQVPVHPSSNRTKDNDMITTTMTKSFHSRLCTSLVVIDHLSSTTKQSSTFIISGSEDMTIKIFRLNNAELMTIDNDGSCVHDALSLIYTLTDHPDAIRCLALVERHNSINTNDNNNNTMTNNNVSLLTLYSAGSCHYLHANQLKIVDDIDKSVTTLSVRSYGGIGGKVWKLTGKVWLRQAETEAMRMTKMDIRITALTAFAIDTQTDCVVTGDSTGRIIIYLFAYSTFRFYQLQNISAAHNRVVMALTHVCMTATNEYFVLSGGSDGLLCVWNLTRLLQTAINSLLQSRLTAVQVSAPEKRVKQRTSAVINDQHTTSDDTFHDAPADDVVLPFLSIAAHQCGCNAIVAYATDDHRIIIVTGGDDQMMRVSAVSVDTNNTTCSPLDVTTNVISNAHTSSITSLTLYDRHTLLSSGYDQRLRRWRIVDDRDVRLIPLDVCQVNVSDITSLAISTAVNMNSNNDNECLSQRRRIFVGGDGMQLVMVD